MIYLSVDRIDEGYAVCEDDNGICVEIELSLLPVGVKETDVIKLDNGKYYIDKKQTRVKKMLSVKLKHNIFDN